MSKLDYVGWLRARVGHAKVILVYASAVITDRQGRVLLERRSDFPWWGLPGGILERGERLEDCLVREVKEETGLEVRPEHLVGVYSSPDFDVAYPNGDQVQQLTVCFASRVKGGVPKPDGQEILNLTHFPLDDLPQVPPWYRAMIEDFATGSKSASFRRGRPGEHITSEYLPWLRQFVGSEPIIIVGVSACIRDELGQLLLVRRADDGTWAFPAGAMELGERVDQAIVREVEEETGLQVTPERMVGIYSGPEFFHIYPNKDQAYIVTAFFDCRVIGGSLQPDGRETLDARFFSTDRLPSLHPRHRIRVGDALAGQTAAVWR
ncbi:MAG: NUDIX domain-containing protein [Anaerolineae bacterium]